MTDEDGIVWLIKKNAMTADALNPPIPEVARASAVAYQQA